MKQVDGVDCIYSELIPQYEGERGDRVATQVHPRYEQAEGSGQEARLAHHGYGGRAGCPWA